MSDDEKSGGKESDVQSTAQAISQLVKEIPIYQDLAQPSAKALGEGLGGLLGFLMAPLQKLGLQSQHNVELFKNELTASVETIPSESVVAPNPQIMGSTIQALTYTVQEAELRALFVKLLASASDARKKDAVHPSYVDIIKHLSPRDAELLKIIGGDTEIAAVRVCSMLSDSVYDVIYTHVTRLSHSENLGAYSASFDNLIRLKIFDEEYYTVTYNDLEAYIPIMGEVRKVYPYAKETTVGLLAATVDAGDIAAQLGLLMRTQYGRHFYESCVQ